MRVTQSNRNRTRRNNNANVQSKIEAFKKATANYVSNINHIVNEFNVETITRNIEQRVRTRNAVYPQFIRAMELNDYYRKQINDSLQGMPPTIHRNTEFKKCLDDIGPADDILLEFVLGMNKALGISGEN